MPDKGWEICHPVTSPNCNSDQALRNPQSYSTLYFHRKGFSLSKWLQRGKCSVSGLCILPPSRKSCPVAKGDATWMYISVEVWYAFAVILRNKMVPFLSPSSLISAPQKEWNGDPLSTLESHLEVYQARNTSGRETLLRTTSELLIFPKVSSSAHSLAGWRYPLSHRKPANLTPSLSPLQCPPYHEVISTLPLSLPPPSSLL